MKPLGNSPLSILVVLLLGSIAISAAELVPITSASTIATNSLELHLFAPSTASPGQTIAIEMWTIFENATSGRSDLAFNHTATAVANTTLTFVPTTNLGPVPPHIHTPGGSFVTLPLPKFWVHHGAYSTNYTVPSQLGLYGVHVYINYTIIPSPRGAVSVYIAQAETTFLVQNAPSTVTDVSNLATQPIVYGVLGLVVVSIILDALLLFWKKSPVKA